MSDANYQGPLAPPESVLAPVPTQLSPADPRRFAPAVRAAGEYAAGELHLPQLLRAQGPWEAAGETAMGVLSAAGSLLTPEVRGAQALTRAGAKALPKAAEALAPAAEQAVRGIKVPAEMKAALAEGKPGLISQRLVTAKGRTPEQAALYEAQRRGPMLTVGTDAMRQDPEAWRYAVSLLRDPDFSQGIVANKLTYPLPRGLLIGDTERDAQAFQRHVADNLLFLWDSVSEWRERAKLWYVGANTIANQRAKHYGLPDASVAGVYAALSPQKDWFMNVSLGDRLMYTALEHGGHQFDLDMARTAQRIFADPDYAAALQRVSRARFNDLELAADKAMWLRIFDETHNVDTAYPVKRMRVGDQIVEVPRRPHQIVTPEGEWAGVRMNKDMVTPTDTAWGSLVEIAKAIRSLESKGDRYVISQAMGEANKVRNFYNNIYDPWSRHGDVTIDTHAVGAGLLLPVGGGDIPVMHSLSTSPQKGGWGRLGTTGSPSSGITGAQGTYGLYADAYRLAAGERKVLPREMQSVTWEAIRALFPGEEKDTALKMLVAQLWHSGVPLDEIRQQIVRAGGGFRHPDWHGK
ncbi:MAG TPA: hypothetical protein VF748_04995 [Candidatus Acidoferrum sp.]